MQTSIKHIRVSATEWSSQLCTLKGHLRFILDPMSRHKYKTPMFLDFRFRLFPGQNSKMHDRWSFEIGERLTEIGERLFKNDGDRLF